MTSKAQEERTPPRIGLTGGIATGKSTVVEMFAELGATVIDTDVIARQVVMPGQPALNEIREAFGKSVINSDGTLDRAAMRKLVFADNSARGQLEAILHPRIGDETRRQSRSAETSRRLTNQPTSGYQIIVIPLLVESSLKSFVERILVVDCDEETQISRLLERDAESEQQAQRILAAQTSREERLAIADDVIVNNGSLDETKSQVADLHTTYLGL